VITSPPSVCICRLGKDGGVDIADRIELHELPGRYGDAIDDRDWDALGRIFTDDAVFDLTDLGGPRCEGLEAIKDFMDRFAEHPKTHLMTNVYVNDTGSAVELRFRIVAMLSGGKMGSASYYDEVVRTPQGWRVAHRVVTRHRRGAPRPR
jgi:ketosteroid isomerase-like protein